MRDAIERYWTEMHEVLRGVSSHAIERAADMLLDCYERDGTVFILGNGGSAATASHIACDLVKGTRNDFAPAFRVVALTDNVPLMTAWANDTSYERIFAEQLSALVRPRDVVIVISCSGTSSNVVMAAKAAEAAGATTIALTGGTGGLLYKTCDLTIRVPAGCIEQVEDAHLIIGHSFCVALRERLLSRGEGAPAAVPGVSPAHPHKVEQAPARGAS